MVKARSAAVLLVALLMVLEVRCASGQLSAGIGTSYSAPDYLGQSMTVTVLVSNDASIPMQVQSVTVNFDWPGGLFNGDAPRVLQAGEKSTWEFDNIQIPSTTWAGKHSYDADAVVGWADSSGGWSHTMPLHLETNFGAQEAPPPPISVNTLAITVNQYVPSTPDLSGMWVILILLAMVVVVAIIIRRTGNSTPDKKRS